tara:strand:- start:199 stop:468 length:270 start_codon:yes stop_codon:yes gene_type:complete
MSLGERLRTLRTEKKLLISEVARHVGVSVSTYRDWEYGREIKGEPYLKLATLLNVNLTYLLTGKDSEVFKGLEEIESIVKNIRLFLRTE